MRSRRTKSYDKKVELIALLKYNGTNPNSNPKTPTLNRNTKNHNPKPKSVPVFMCPMVKHCFQYFQCFDKFQFLSI